MWAVGEHAADEVKVRDHLNVRMIALVHVLSESSLGDNRNAIDVVLARYQICTSFPRQSGHRLNTRTRGNANSQVTQTRAPRRFKSRSDAESLLSVVVDRRAYVFVPLMSGFCLIKRVFTPDTFST